MGTNERSEAALKLPTSRKPVCAADHGVQSAAVASGFRRARGKRANLRGRPRCAVSGRRVRVLARCPRGDCRAACLCDVARALLS